MFVVEAVDFNAYKDQIIKFRNSVYYEECGYFAEEQFSEDRYDSVSAHFVTLHDNEVIAYIRVITPVEGLPAFELVSNVDANVSDISNCVEFSRLMVARQHRKGLSILCYRLMKEALRYTLSQGYDVIITDIFLDSLSSDTYALFSSLGFTTLYGPYIDNRYGNRQSLLLSSNLASTIVCYKHQRPLLHDLCDEFYAECHEKFLKNIEDIRSSWSKDLVLTRAVPVTSGGDTSAGNPALQKLSKHLHNN